MSFLTRWIDDPRPTTGISFYDESDGWHFTSYTDFAAHAAGTAAWLRDLGVRDDDVVSIALPSGPQFVSALFGVLHAGATPSLFALPGFFESEDHYVDHVGGVLAIAQPSVVIVDAVFAGVVGRAAERGGIAGRVHVYDIDLSRRLERPGKPPELGLLQFTSGSSGRPRGVQVGYENLEANVRAIHAWLEMVPEDLTATWLPLYHDMGLIGTLMTPVAHQTSLMAMRPEQFVREPMRWIECFGAHGANITASPTFGFGYAARHIKPELIADMDFSPWRVAICGAERVDAGVLERFARLLEGRAFRRDAYLPAYGLAEATLAVTGRREKRAPNMVRLDWEAVEYGRRVTVVERTRLGEHSDDGSGWLVACGRPLRDVQVSIVDADGLPVSEDHVGEVRVCAPSVAAGYKSDPDHTAERFTVAGLRTGDAGFVHDGELYVLGRLGDSLKVRGRTVFAEELEAKLVTHPAIRPGRCVVMSGRDRLGDMLSAIVESDPGDWTDHAASVLHRFGGPETRVRVLRGPAGTILRTSSGKPRRRVMWQALLERRLVAEVLYDSATL